MKPKILITGPPRCGKSTLISKLIKHLQKNFKIYGFLTPEVKKINKREGFDVEDIYSKKRFPLARVDYYNTKFKLGRYSVFVEEFENYLDDILNIEEHIGNLIVIDEIGKMELFSKKFQDLIKSLFQSETPIIATIGQKITHPIKDYILKIPNTALFTLNRQNQEEIFHKITSIIAL